MTGDYWGRFRDTYDQNQEYVVGKQFLEEIRQELQQLDDLGDALEFGCGTGNFTTAIVGKCTSLLATDLSEDLLEAARLRLHEHPEVVFQKENCMETSLSPDSFDSVFMANLLHVVEDPNRVLQECHRVVRCDGRIVIATFTAHGMSLWEKIKMGVRFSRTWGKPPAHTHSFTPVDMGAMLQDCGFTVEQLKLLGDKTKALFVVGKKG